MTPSKERWPEKVWVVRQPVGDRQLRVGFRLTDPEGEEGTNARSYVPASLLEEERERVKAWEAALREEAREEGCTVARCRDDGETELALLASERALLFRSVADSLADLQSREDRN